MNLYFLDTSALVKIYHREAGSDYCLELYTDTSPLIITELARVELRSALFRKQREAELSTKATKAVLQRFEYDCKERYEVLPGHREPPRKPLGNIVAPVGGEQLYREPNMGAEYDPYGLPVSKFIKEVKK